MTTVEVEVVGYDYDEVDRGCWRIRLPSVNEIVTAQNLSFSVDGRELTGQRLLGVLCLEYSIAKRVIAGPQLFAPRSTGAFLSPSQVILRGQLAALYRSKYSPLYHLVDGVLPVCVDINDELPGGPLAIGEWFEACGTLAFDPEPELHRETIERLPA